MHPIRPNNRLSRSTRNLHSLSLERRAKHGAQVIIHFVAVDIVREDLLRVACKKAVGRSGDFERDAA
jgi:hypothetical protein